MKKTLPIVVVVLVVIAIAVVWYLRRPSGSAAVAVGSAGGSASPTAPGSDAGSAAPAPAKKRVEKLADRAAHDKLLESIRAARAKATGGTIGATGTTPVPTLPSDPVIEKQYIRASVREIIPLLTECYEQGLERDPTIKGTIVVDFTIEGEEGVGGVIGQSAIVPDKSDLGDAGVRECVQETMYALKIEPPVGGGVVHVTYPFAFSSGEDSGSGGSAGSSGSGSGH